MSFLQIEQALLAEGPKDPANNQVIAQMIAAGYETIRYTPSMPFHGLPFLESQEAAMHAIPPNWGIQRIEGSNFGKWEWLVTLSTQSLHRDYPSVRSYGLDGTEPVWLWPKTPAIALTLAGLRAWAVLLEGQMPEVWLPPS